MKMSSSWNTSLLPSVGIGILVGCSIFCGYYFTLGRVNPPKCPPKKRKFVTPKWAISRAKDFEPPQITEEERDLLERTKPEKIWNTVIFFPDLMPEMDDAPTQRLLQYFKEARTSINLCMYLCSHVLFSDLLKEMYIRKGIIVEVISEYDTWTAHNNFGIKCLERTGIEVRLNANGSLMHNKFAIIDEAAVLTGSLNWTKQGVTSNNENVLITTNPVIVKKYMDQFYKLWRASKTPTKLNV